METLEVKCPDCANTLIVDKKTGKVVEVRRPIVEESTGDRFEDARQKVLSATERAEQRFKEAKERESQKMAKLEKLFKEKAEELKDQPIERPDHPMDFD